MQQTSSNKMMQLQNYNFFEIPKSAIYLPTAQDFRIIFAHDTLLVLGTFSQ
jgi:hypothetical protein